MPTQPPLDPVAVLGLPAHALPRHIAIIMDGNGRWAQQRNLPRIEGHRHAATAVRDVVTHCARLGIECLTLYSFSLENWKRPRPEVDGLMALYAHYLASERAEILANDIRVRQVGRRAGLPAAVLHELDVTEGLSRNNQGMTLCLALNYGARAELVDTFRKLAERVAAGTLAPDKIDEQIVAGALYTAGLPDPDLVIRTAGELRISNFLLWQISYAELYVTPVLWPDFATAQLNEALQEYARRVRRFGDVIAPPATGHAAGGEPQRT
ncbi:MAG: isoprenyl transferase [Phycisphaerales bacterium]|nr:isoprenyl transferase [Phycisphaerales bacterium]